MRIRKTTRKMVRMVRTEKMMKMRTHMRRSSMTTRREYSTKKMRFSMLRSYRIEISLKI